MFKQERISVPFKEEIINQLLISIFKFAHIMTRLGTRNSKRQHCRFKCHDSLHKNMFRYLWSQYFCIYYKIYRKLKIVSIFNESLSLK